MVKCSFHPNLLFCDSIKWEKNEEFRDYFVENLKNHLDIIYQLNIDIVWTDNFFNIFWSNSPWLKDQFYMHYLMDWIYQKIESQRVNLDSPPDDICKINPDVKLNFNCDYLVIKNEWLILLHRMIHNYSTGKIINNDETKKEYSLSCNCIKGIKLNYEIIQNPLDWFCVVGYWDYWPDNYDDFDIKFDLMISICYYQEFRDSGYKRKITNIEYGKEFKDNILVIDGITETKLIISSITKRICKDIGEAGRDSGLQEEKINDNLFRFRVSQGGRIHHELYALDIRLLNYYPPSSHP